MKSELKPGIRKKLSATNLETFLYFYCFTIFLFLRQLKGGWINQSCHYRCFPKLWGVPGVPALPAGSACQPCRPHRSGPVSRVYFRLRLMRHSSNICRPRKTRRRKSLFVQRPAADQRHARGGERTIVIETFANNKIKYFSIERRKVLVLTFSPVFQFRLRWRRSPDSTIRRSECDNWKVCLTTTQSHSKCVNYWNLYWLLNVVSVGKKVRCKKNSCGWSAEFRGGNK